MLDILIRNGTVLDGTGAPGRRADVAIQDGRIVEVGQLHGAQAATVIEAAGRAVTPGFVDMHSHADRTLPILPTADSLVRQGITTVVGGMCGATLVPLLPETREEVIARKDSDEAPLPWERWSTYGSYLDYLREIGISLNMAPLVGQGTVREAVMGFVSAAPTAEQIAHMQAEFVRAMEDGAIGLSTGLIYPPGSYASTDELIAVTRPVGERDGYYFSHIRGEAAQLLEA
ncbi:MAG: amidohydrolase family protein, partial [Chloroflexi bacterium]|nr:amidohydrolase family protein [Chloroflexota bacterium]